VVAVVLVAAASVATPPTTWLPSAVVAVDPVRLILQETHRVPSGVTFSEDAARLGAVIAADVAAVATGTLMASPRRTWS
jgi:hypothetical protein